MAKSAEKSTKRSLLPRLAIATTIGASILINRIFTQGPHLPLECSLFKLNCITDVPSRGYVHDDYQNVASAFQNNFIKGYDVGAALSVYVDDQLVVDIQGGYQDADRQIPFTEDTLTLVYSCTKVLSSIVTAQLVEKGKLDFSEKIATYWPEFAQGQKENVTLGDLLRHTAGVGGFDQKLSLSLALDTEAFSAFLAAQPHNFGGTPQRSYHAISGGWYLNEILRRTVGVTVDDVAASFAEKYNVEWHLKPHQESFQSRMSKMHDPPKLYRIVNLIYKLLHPNDGIGLARAFDKKGIMYKTVVNPTPDQVAVSDFASHKMRQLEGPSYSGYTNAKSMAKLAAMMANGGRAIVPGEPDLLSEEGFALATRPLEPQYDEIIRMNTPLVEAGFGLFTDIDPDALFVGWSGAAGSIFFWEPTYKIGFGYVTNTLIGHDIPPDLRSISLLQEVIKSVKEAKATKLT